MHRAVKREAEEEWGKERWRRHPSSVNLGDGTTREFRGFE